MAVDQHHHSGGVGFWMLGIVVGIARNIGKNVGVRYVSIDVKKDRKRLIAWYKRFGFKEKKGQSTLLMRLYKLATRADLEHVSLRLDILRKEEVNP